MSIAKCNDEVGLECDECGTTFWGGTLDFREMIAEAKSEGWVVRKDDVDCTFTHICQDCENSC